MQNQLQGHNKYTQRNQKAVSLTPDILKILESTREGALEELETIGDYTKPAIFDRIEKYRKLFIDNAEMVKFFDSLVILKDDELMLPNGIIYKLGYPDVEHDGKEVFKINSAVYMKHGNKLKKLRYKMRKDGWRLPGEVNIDEEYDGKIKNDHNSLNHFRAEREFKYLLPECFPYNKKNCFGRDERAKMVIDLLGFKPSRYIDRTGHINTSAAYDICFWGPITTVQDTFSWAEGCHYAYHFAEPSYVTHNSFDMGYVPLFIKDTKGVLDELHAEYERKHKK